jgi:hypothetical protein
MLPVAINIMLTTRTSSSTTPSLLEPQQVGLVQGPGDHAHDLRTPCVRYSQHCYACCLVINKVWGYILYILVACFHCWQHAGVQRDTDAVG